MDAFRKKYLLFLIICWFSSLPLQGQSLLERLGYPPDARVLILHADDLGMAHSINRASFETLDAEAITSASLMVPCPWFLEVAAYAREHPERDLGLHLTLTSEWNYYRWAGLLGPDQTPSLHDSLGYLYSTTDEAVTHITPEEAAAEIEAQIQRAQRAGIPVSHLDTHMRVLHQTPELFAVYLEAGRKHNLPVFIPREQLATYAPDLLELLSPDDLVIDRVWSVPVNTPPEAWLDTYLAFIEQLPPGITQIIVHLGYADEELQSATVGHENFGALWRQRDLEVVRSSAFQEALRRRGVILTTWRELYQRFRARAGQ